MPHTQADKVKLAVDACIELNQWSRAVQLAEKYKLPEISSYLAKYAAPPPPTVATSNKEST